VYGGQVAVHARHRDIEHHQAQLRGVLPCQLDTCDAIARPETVIARKGALNQAHERAPQQGIVVDNQDN
jgi:hypothetical protein